MDIALCYESVLPERGGCETYIADLARRFVADGHRVHLYASCWDSEVLPTSMKYHPLPQPKGPRFLRPWQFSLDCVKALGACRHDVSMGFNKTWGQDILYPQAGLHVASAEHNLRKHRPPLVRAVARLIRQCDLAHWSYCLLERKQYLGPKQPAIIANSKFVRGHFQQYYRIAPEKVRVIYSAIDASRFHEQDRPRRRLEYRQQWGIDPEATVALFVAMNYELKGLEPLISSLQHVSRERPMVLLIAGNPNFTHYEKQARYLGVSDRVRFVGFCKDTRSCYFASDFLVHPTFYDPCSLVVLEALACGLPVITSRFNGARELLDPPNDSLIIDDPFAVKHLGGCIEQFLDPVRRIGAAQAARRNSLRWHFDIHYRQLVDVLSEVAKAKRAA
jgi:UDP-glucose:(heptosyl)LPS alpha-1,3-glucosyltransferase